MEKRKPGQSMSKSSKENVNVSEDQFEAEVLIGHGSGALTVVSNDATQASLNMEFRQSRLRETLACVAGCAVGPMSEDDFELAVKKLNEAQTMLRAMWVIKHRRQG